MNFDENTETVRFKLNTPDELKQQMSEELERAPTYMMTVEPGKTGPTITTLKSPGMQDISTATGLKCGSLYQKLSASGIQGDVTPSSRYERLGVLGEGGTGHVYEMLDHNVQRTVAVKLLKGSDVPTEVNAFIREGILAAELEHPNIIPIYDMDADDNGRVYLSMKKVEGEHLMSLVETGDITLPDMIAVFLKVCDALSYAHSQNKVHQDVKPENIMVGEFGEVFLIDWGAGSESGAEMQVSPVYMSPQQAAGEPAIPSDDIYCLGASLFHALTKRFPTNANTIDELWEKKLEGVIDMPTTEEMAVIPSALLAIALKALEPDPIDRYQTIVELAADIKAYQNGFATSAEHAGLLTLLSLLLKRRWKEISVATAIVIAVLGFSTKYYIDVNRAKFATLEAELVVANLKLEKREQWIPFQSADFTKPDGISPGFDGNAPLVADPNGLNFGFRSGLGFIGLTEALYSEPKIEVTFTCDDVPQLELLTVNGSNETIRSLIIDDQVSFHTIDTEWAGVFTGAKMVSSVLRKGTPNTLVFWLRNGTWHVELNGENFMTYYDANLDSLSNGIVFKMKRQLDLSELRILSISVWSRQAPSVVSILEPGKALQRKGNVAAAREWFLKQAKSAAKPDIAKEGAYLAAITNTGAGIEEQIRELQTIADQTDNEFRYHAQHKMAILSSRTADLTRTLDYLGNVTQNAPELNTYNAIRDSLGRQFLMAAEDVRERAIAKLSMLPLTTLSLDTCGLTTVKPMNKTVRSLSLTDNPVGDLSPLNGLSLIDVRFDHTDVQDISPLRGMSLKRLKAAKNSIGDLSPLEGMRLEVLSLKQSKVPIDLATLNDTVILKPLFDDSPLKNIHFFNRTGAVHPRLRGCGLTNLDFVKGMNLCNIDVTGNAINDISGLAGQRLKMAYLSSNQISDLTPFKSISISGSLSISKNPVEDLSPLAGQPLHGLDISHTNVTDLSVLRTLKNLRRLRFDSDGNSPPPNLRYLETCNLISVSLVNQGLSSVASLKNCRISEALNLRDNPLSDVSPLSKQPLKELNLVNTNVTDLSPLSGLKELAIFTIGNDDPDKPSALDAIQPVCRGQLESLQAANCSIRDISSLQNCKALRYLDVSGNPLVDINALEGLEITRLNLSDTQVTDFSALHALKKLQILTIDGRSRDKSGAVTDLSDFSGLTLVNLSLANNTISDIKPLRSTMIRDNLDVSGNPIEDLSPLKKHQVKHLNISGTKVTDLSAIRTMPNLETLTIHGLKLDAASEQLLKQMPWLEVIRDHPAKR